MIIYSLINCTFNTDGKKNQVNIDCTACNRFKFGKRTNNNKKKKKKKKDWAELAAEF